MSDVLTPEQRRKCMSSVRGVNTGPELLLRKALWHHGLRYKLKSNLPGRPDVVLKRYKTVIFVDGCFWHGCPKHGALPKTNSEFWKKKLDRNIDRDNEINNLLEKQGWRVVRVWEHEIKESLQVVVQKILSDLNAEIYNTPD